jgi:ATP-binding protein involved in chromosome partitioning
MTFYPQLILDALKHVRYPGTGIDIVSAEMVDDDIRIDGNKIFFSLVFDKPNDPFAKSLVKAAEQAVLMYAGAEAEIKGNIAIRFKNEIPKVSEKALSQVKNIIAVSSGKGGVGNRPFRPTLPWHWLSKATRWDCWMPIFLVRPFPKCLDWRMRDLI